MPVIARLISALGDIPLTAENSRFRPSTPSLTVTSANVDGQAVSDIIPTKAWVAVDRRLLPGDLSADPATDDPAWLGNAGISTILCGPGDAEQAHTVGESIDVADLRDAIQIFASLCLAAKYGDSVG